MSSVVYHYIVPLPPRALSPNGGSAKAHWRKIAAARKDYREACRLSLLDARYDRPRRPLELSRVSITAWVCRRRPPPGDATYRPLDQGNLLYATKQVFDALQDVGVIVDDKQAHMVLGDALIKTVTPHALECIAIKVERLEEGDGA